MLRRPFALIAMLQLAGLGMEFWAGSAQAVEDKASSPPKRGTDTLGLDASKILISRCLNCHSSTSHKGKLDLSTRSTALAGGSSGEPAIVPGKPGESDLIAKIEAGEMPPRNPLPKAQIETLRAWVAAGAHYTSEPLRPRAADPGLLWSLKPIRNPAPPHSYNETWARNPIDRFILARLEAEGLPPSPEADRRTLIRRATLDLTGLPPTPDEITAFLNDHEPLAYERLVDRLLASPHYGERWGRHWLDVVRFGESHGYETNMPRYNAWPYRDYVIQAFNRDLPCGDFVRDQLAGDTLGRDFGLSLAATGFLVAGTHDEVGNATRQGMLQQRMDDLDDMITAVCSTFLGLTVHCARCHDHKFDPIPQRDYYALQALLSGVRHGARVIRLESAKAHAGRLEAMRGELALLERELDEHEPVCDVGAAYPRRSPVSSGRNVERIAPVLCRSVRLTITATNDGAEPCIDEIEIYGPEPPGRNLAAAEGGARARASSEYPNNPRHKIEHLNDGRGSNERSWISREPGQGRAQIILAAPAVIDRIVWARDRDGVYRDRLAVDYRIEAEIEPAVWRLIASSRDRARPGASPAGQASASLNELSARRDALRDQLLMLEKTEASYVGVFEAPALVHILKRGDVMQPGDWVDPAAPAAVPPRLVLDSNATDPDRRRALAGWIADPRNPLPMRVLANRIWLYHFGAGLVATPNDFGSLGSPPSHPELLDWLASELAHQGGRLKPLHRLIMLSSTYRQTSTAHPRGLTRDAQTTLLWRFPPRRLEAEAIRDAILFTAGQLDSRIGGPSYSIWIKNTNYVATYNLKPHLDPSTYRRMVYQLRPRGRLDNVFGVFDCPDASQSVPRRPSSTTATQALALWNSEFILQQAQALAARVERENPISTRAVVSNMFARTLGRPPSDRELEAASSLVVHDHAQALARVLYNSSEFVTLP